MNNGIFKHLSGGVNPVCLHLFLTGLFQVEEVLLYEQENARFHNTLPFNIIYGAHPSAVLRRGFPFKVGIRFNQEVDLSQTNIKIFMQLGE